jgi:integrase/recombinase XerC
LASIRKLPGHCWQVRWSVTIIAGPRTGEVITGSRVLHDKQAALLFKRDKEREHDYIAAGLDQHPELIEIAKQAWFEHIKALTPRTQELYTTHIDRFIPSLPKGVTQIGQIRAKHIRDFLASLIKDGLKHRTANIHLDVIRSFCNFIADHYEIQNAAKQVKPFKEDPPNRRFLTDDEYSKILAAADSHVKDVLEFIGNTGLRASEFVKARWSDIAPDQSSLTVLGKGRKYRTVPLNSTCREILNRQPHKSDYIYLSKSHELLSRHSLSGYCEKLATKLKIKRFGPHSFRHYFATTLLYKGVPIQHVSAILGHSSIAITQSTYIHVLPAHLGGKTDCLTLP